MGYKGHGAEVGRARPCRVLSMAEGGCERDVDWAQRLSIGAGCRGKRCAGSEGELVIGFDWGGYR